MRRIIAVLIVCLCLPAVALAAYSKGSWSGTGKVPNAESTSFRTVKLKADVGRRECKKLTGIDETGVPETKQVRGMCFAFRGGHSYQAQCKFASGTELEQTVTPPSDYVIGRGGVYSVDERTKIDNPSRRQEVSNRIRLTLRGKRATGKATYRSEQFSAGGNGVCTGTMNISLRHR